MRSNYDDSSHSREPKSISVLILFPLILMLLGSLALVVWWVQPWHKSGLNPDAEPRVVTARGDLSEQEKMNISIYESASPSVVHVTNLSVRGDQFSLDVQRIPKGTGSGFVWDKDGHIVTNYHVVEGADAASVTLADHTSYSARNIWAAPEQDIAVLQIDAPSDKLHPISIGSSHDLKVGQITYAIGNPFGLDQSLTTGIVSALGREIESNNGSPIHGAIQTSAAINPGNSGGPLLDSAGRLIGMNTAIVSPSGAFAGIGFAIPVDQINQTAPELIRNGRVSRPQLGVQIAPDQIAQQLGVSEGVLVLKVMPDSSAAKAGLRGTRRDESGSIRLGDIIMSVDGKKISQVKDLPSALSSHKSGDKITLSIIRDGQQQDVQVTL
jgi:S1-C subfamily serine protease